MKKVALILLTAVFASGVVYSSPVERNAYPAAVLAADTGKDMVGVKAEKKTKLPKKTKKPRVN